MNYLQNQTEDKSTRAKGYGITEKFALKQQVGDKKGDGDDLQTGTELAPIIQMVALNLKVG